MLLVVNGQIGTFRFSPGRRDWWLTSPPAAPTVTTHAASLLFAYPNGLLPGQYQRVSIFASKSFADLAMSDFYKYFNEHMEGLKLPAPDALSTG